ncbi:radical SAM protein, partial [Candidatus Bathyarchaeota archaeon]|nr:radical SAM protein [Candidatus Bathyarchaeota archaeon]
PAKKYSNALDYFERCKEAVTEMYRQVGNLKFDERKIAYRGLVVRHLVLPENQAGSKEVFEYLQDLSKDVYVNVMDQYRPKGRAGQYKKLGRCTTSKEFSNTIQLAKKFDLHKLDN